jgi:hypothetical protein
MIFSAGHAVVVGVGSSDLPNTVDDAKALSDLLRNPECCAYPPGQVQILTEGDAARDNILAALENLAKQADGESTVIVYYSGHGYFVKGGGQKEYFLLPFGYELDNLASTAISDAQFAAALGKIQCKKMLLLLDCCHAAGLDQTKAPGVGLEKGAIPPQAQAVLEAGEGRVIVASSRSDEVSFAGKPYSAFTQALLEGLAGIGAAEQDGYARIADLAMYTAYRVPVRTKERQHPVLNFKKADNFPVAYYSGGERKPKGSPFPAPAEVEPEPGSVTFINRFRANTVIQIARDAVFNAPLSFGGGAGPRTESGSAIPRAGKPNSDE